MKLEEREFLTEKQDTAEEGDRHRTTDLLIDRLETDSFFFFHSYNSLAFSLCVQLTRLDFGV